MKFPIKDFFSKCGQIRRKLRIWSHLLKKPPTENFICCVVSLAGMPSYFHFSLMLEIFENSWWVWIISFVKNLLLCEFHFIVCLRYFTLVTRYGNTSFINVYENAQATNQFGSDGACYKKETSYSNGAVVMM